MHGPRTHTITFNLSKLFKQCSVDTHIQYPIWYNKHSFVALRVCICKLFVEFITQNTWRAGLEYSICIASVYSLGYVMRWSMSPIHTFIYLYSQNLILRDMVDIPTPSLSLSLSLYYRFGRTSDITTTKLTANTLLWDQLTAVFGFKLN